MSNGGTIDQRRITFDIPNATVEALDAYAEAHGVSRSAVVRFSIQFFLNSRPFERMIQPMERRTDGVEHEERPVLSSN